MNKITKFKIALTGFLIWFGCNLYIIFDFIYKEYFK